MTKRLTARQKAHKKSVRESEDRYLAKIEASGEASRLRRMYGIGIPHCFRTPAQRKRMEAMYRWRAQCWKEVMGTPD